MRKLMEEDEFSEMEMTDAPRRGRGWMGWLRKMLQRKYMSVLLVCAILTIISFFIVLLVYVFKPEPKSPPIPDTPEAILQWMRDFQGSVSTASLKATMTSYSEFPHIAGSFQDERSANKTKQIFESYGFNTTVETYYVLLSYPKERHVSYSVAGDGTFVNCSLTEDVVNDGQNYTTKPADTFHGYSPSGTAEGELVYVNYGREEDFQLLESKGVNVTGKVVIVRYGKCFRGNKVKAAQARGAVAVLIYTDPGDYKLGEEYPAGPWATNATVQRGTVWTGRGDPTTPGWPSSQTEESGPRLTIDQARSSQYMSDPLPTIPSQPLSYGDAAPVLKALQGTDIPSDSWQGGLGLTKVGPGPVTVKVQIEAEFKITPIWNVIGEIKGREEPDRYILLGAHRDAWTYGSGDPISGTTVLLETAKGFKTLRDNGWVPRRSIKFCSWDAEEYGLVGSVEWAETHYTSLVAQAVAYLNLDIAVTGTDELWVEGSPSLTSIIKSMADTVQIKTKDGKSVSVLSLYFKKFFGLLGDGSDYTAFLQYCGIAAIDMGFASKDNKYYAVYHSNHDSSYWYEKFGDPQFEYHAAIAKLYGLTALRLATDTILPFNFVDYGESLSHNVDILYNLTAAQTGYDTDKLTSLFLPMRTAVARFNEAASDAANYSAQAKKDPYWISTDGIRQLNDRLMLTERAFLSYDGTLTGSTWYRHVVSAPSKYNSYAGVPFPGLSDILSTGKFTESSLAMMLQRLSIIIEGAAKYLDTYAD